MSQTLFKIEKTYKLFIEQVTSYNVERYKNHQPQLQSNNRTPLFHLHYQLRMEGIFVTFPIWEETPCPLVR